MIVMTTLRLLILAAAVLGLILPAVEGGGINLIIAIAGIFTGAVFLNLTTLCSR